MNIPLLIASHGFAATAAVVVTALSLSDSTTSPDLVSTLPPQVARHADVNGTGASRSRPYENWTLETANARRALSSPTVDPGAADLRAEVTSLTERVRFLEAQMTSMSVVTAVASATGSELRDVVRALWRSDLFADDDSHPQAMELARLMDPRNVWSAVQVEERFWEFARSLGSARPVDHHVAAVWEQTEFWPAYGARLSETAAELRRLGVPALSIDTFVRVARGE